MVSDLDAIVNWASPALWLQNFKPSLLWVKKYSLISIQPTVSKKGSRLILPASALWSPLILFYMLHRSYRSIYYNIKNINRAYSNSPHCQTCLPKVKSSLPTQYNKSIFSFAKESKIVHNSTILTEALHGCSKISFHLSSNLKSLMKYKWTRAQKKFLRHLVKPWVKPLIL